MKTFRSGSQILFGHLPEQTIDANGGIWKVKCWDDPKLISAIDAESLRQELIRTAYPWHEAKNDGGFVEDLYKHLTVKVVSLNRDQGIYCEPFPRLYLCQQCKRLHDEPMGKCECGSTRRRGQLPFVGYHDACGAIKTPYVRKCPKHGQRAVKFPGTASASELIFYCPVCNDVIHTGFGAACDCAQGGALKFTVHRSGTVFKPRGISLINPPRHETMKQIEQSGGGERALEWILEGMPGKQLTDSRGAQNPDTIRKMLRDRGFDEATVEAMVAAMPMQAKNAPLQTTLDAEALVIAERHAKQIAMATFEGRVTIDNLLSASRAAEVTRLYETEYPQALSRAGFERVELIDKFPVLTAQFGYTRGKATPGEGRLRTYRDKNGDYTIYGDLALTEALFIRLDAKMVHQWLKSRGVELTPFEDTRSAAETILQAWGAPEQKSVTSELATELIHSICHAFIKRAAVYAGIDRNALSELLLPTSLGFFVYAAARGDFVLGGLQALFETELHHLLNGLVDDEYRCALDPGCEDTGASCAVCLQLGEPSCRMFNTCLSRKVLAGGAGFFDITAS